jgi:pilus assembly protein Flp/PilA
MLNIKSLLTDFVEDESGLTAVEYAIAGALVAGGVVLAFSNLGDAVDAQIDCLTTVVNGTKTTDCGA